MKRFLPLFLFFALLFSFTLRTKGQSLTTNYTDLHLSGGAAAEGYNTSKNPVMDVHQASGIQVYVWTESDDPTNANGQQANHNIYCQIYDKSLNPLTTVFLVNQSITGDQTVPNILFNQNTYSFIVTWAGNQGANNYDIYAKKIDVYASDPTQAATQPDLIINVNTVNMALNTTGGIQSNPILTYDYSYDEVIIAWNDLNGQDGSGYGVFARRVNFDNFSLVKDQWQINQVTTNTQDVGTIAISPAGALYMVYNSNDNSSYGFDIRRVKFTRNATADFSSPVEILVNNYRSNDQTGPVITFNHTTGDYIINWNSQYEDGAGLGVYARPFDKNDNQKTIPNITGNGEFLVHISPADNHYNGRLAWDEQTGYLMFFYIYANITAGVTDSYVRYQLFNSTYNAYGTEGLATNNGSGGQTNTNNEYGSSIWLVYNQQFRTLELTWNIYSGSYNESRLRQFTYTNSSIVPATNTVSCNNVETQNYMQETLFDEDGNIVSDTRTYADGMGRKTQSQTRNLETNNILASQNIYDTYGRAAVQTLPAAIGQQCFGYNTNLSQYTYANFDGTNWAKVNNPDPVSTTSVLGAYYSTANPEMVATSSYPYSRIFYNDVVPGGMVRAASAGESLRMGSGHERQAIVLPLLTELDVNYLPVRNNFVSGSPSTLAYQGMKTIALDENGNGTVTFKNKEGQTLATAITGGLSVSRTVSLSSGYYYYNYVTTNSNVYGFSAIGTAPLTMGTTPDGYQQVRSTAPFTVQYSKSYYAVTVPTTALQTYYPTQVPGNSSVDIFCSATNFSLSSSNAGTDLITITNLVTGVVIYSGTVSGYSGATAPGAGYYRIALTYQAITHPYSSSELTVTYTDNFTNWGYYFYDNAGHMVAQTAPNGVNLSSSASPSFTTTYTYDTQGRALKKTDNADRGTTQYVYRKDGRLRFSQNSLQAATGTGRFTFINYDLAGRPIATGEFNGTGSWVFENQALADVSTNNTYGIHSLLSPGTDGNLMSLNNGINSCSTVVYSRYDSADPTCGRTQSFMAGKVSSSYKKTVANASANTSQTWYSYDEFGRIIWTVQSVNGLTGNKTLDYTYNMNGSLTDVVYQASTPTERWEHKYNFDKLLRVDSVFTRQGSYGFMKQAAYYYYNYGALKRTELGGKLQGLDYTYTINGWLKAINDPNFTAATDPGGDGITGGAHPTFQKDVFGMTLEYYDNDYVRNSSFQTTSNLGTTITLGTSTTSFPNQYNGNVRSTVWGTTGSGSNTMAQYAYTYDYKNQLSYAVYGTNNGSRTFVPDPSNRYEVYSNFYIMGHSTDPIQYDLNGNAIFLARNDNNGNIKDDIWYQYSSGSNKLQSTLLNSTQATNRTYAYDVIGRMVSCSTTVSGELTKYLTYDVFDHVTGVYASAGTTQPLATFTYDDKGHRLSKTSYNPTTYVATTTTWYIRDAAGSIISAYNNTTGTMAQAELPIYGKSRIGNAYCQPSSQAIYDYEINDHLGNMRATVSLNNNNTFVVSAYADYYPQGGLLPGRNNSTPNYRYGYQGQYAEADGETQLNAFDLRMYDPVTSRMISPDPMNQYWSPYLAMGNNFTNSIDPTGGKTLLGKALSWVGGGASQAGHYVGKEATHLWNWSPPGYKAFHNYEEQHRQTFIDIGVVVASIAIGVLTDGIGDIAIGEESAEEGGFELGADNVEDASTIQFNPEATTNLISKDITIEDWIAQGTGKTLGNIIVEGTQGALSGAASSGLASVFIDHDKFGGPAFWKSVGLGALSGALGDIAGSFYGKYEDIPRGMLWKGALKGATESGVKAFSSGFFGGIIHGGYGFTGDLKLGLYSGAFGVGFGAAGGMANWKGTVLPLLETPFFLKHDGTGESLDDSNDGFFGDWESKLIHRWAGIPDGN